MSMHNSLNSDHLKLNLRNTPILNYTRITNVSHVEAHGAKLWAHYILIDKAFDPATARSLQARQICGYSNGGIHVFTYWIDPQAEVQIADNDTGGVLMMREDKDPISLGSGVRITVGDLVLDVAVQDHDQPMDITEISVDMCPHGPAVDEEILKYYDAPAYMVTTYVNADVALAMSKEFDPSRRF
jgi:hypothetical protein